MSNITDLADRRVRRQPPAHVTPRVLEIVAGIERMSAAELRELAGEILLDGRPPWTLAHHLLHLADDRDRPGSPGALAASGAGSARAAQGKEVSTMPTATATITCPSWSWCRLDHTREPGDHHAGYTVLGPDAEVHLTDLPDSGRSIDIAAPEGAGGSSLVDGAEASVQLDAAATARLAEVLNELLNA